MADKPDRFIVIMAGGRGERFWPQSRLSRPKHLLPIVGDKPMLTQTIDRLEGVVAADHIFIITNVEQRDAVIECCPDIPVRNIVAEPVGRDTAAAVGLATVLVKHVAPEAAFAMLPADHVIHDVEGFRATMKAAFEAAEQSDALVTVGIRPAYPATGYGYVRRGAQVKGSGKESVFEVDSFREKPDAATAEKYIESGSYYWNAGMFFWRVPVIADCFARFTPKLWKALEAIADGLKRGEALETLLEDRYGNLERISVDYAIMEKAEAVQVVEANFDWDDVGEWPAVARHHQLDDQGNAIQGSVLIEKGSRNIVVGSSGRLVTVVGADDLMVIETEDAILVCPKAKAQEIKGLVKRISADPNWKHLV